MIKINNMEAYARDYKYIVARQIRKHGHIDYWFYGAWNDRDEANEVALELGNGAVFKTSDIFPEPIEGTKEDWCNFCSWLRINHELRVNGYHMSSIEKEVMEYEKQYREAIS